MSFRVTPHRQYELGRSTAQSHFARLASAQMDVSTGVRIHKPSDDPRAQKLILGQQSAIQRIEAQLNVITDSRATLSTAQSMTLDAQQLLVQAKTLSLEARQATEETDRLVIADQLDAILKQLEGIANAQVDGKYLFAGSQTSTKPFSGIVNGSTQYHGGKQSGSVSIAGQPAFEVFYSGRDVFLPSSSGNLVVTGSTGIQAGTGTASGAASTTLTVTHTQTTYAAGSGIQAGVSSAGGDTIIGQTGTHTVTIRDTSGNGSSGTISLNGGVEVAFTNADDNLQVTGPNGEVIYVDTRNITAGFDGTIDLTAEGTISIDGGPATAINFSANQTLVDEQRGIVQHFNTQNVTRTGTAHVEPEQTGDIFEVIRSVRDDLRNERNLNPEEWNAALERDLGDLDAANDHLLDVVGRQSVALEYLNSLETRLADTQLETEKNLSETQGADITTALLALQEEQNLLQYTLATMSTLTNTSILDFL